MEHLIYTIKNSASGRVIISSSYKEVIELWFVSEGDKILKETRQLADLIHSPSSINLRNFQSLQEREYQLSAMKGEIGSRRLAAGDEYRNCNHTLVVEVAEVK